MEKIGITLDVPSVEYNKTITVTVKDSEPQILEGYWVNKEGEKIRLHPYSEDLTFRFKVHKETIGKEVTFEIYDADYGVLGDDRLFKRTYVIKYEHNKISIPLTGKLFKKGGNNILKLYVVFELEGKKYDFPKDKNDYMKIHVVEFVPKVMKAQNPSWEKASRCQDIWFSRNIAQKPYYSDIVTNIVTMDWLKHFERIYPTLKRIKAKMWETKASINLFCQRLREMIQNKDVVLPQILGIGNSFGSFSNRQIRFNNEGVKTTLLDRYNINELSYMSSIGDPLDDLYGTLGNFILRITPSGIIYYMSNDTYRINYKKIAVYFIDSFDFQDNKFDLFAPSSYISQPLGYWDVSNNIVSKNPFSSGYYIDNKSYQNYQEDYNKGGDFILISDCEVINVDFTFDIKRSFTGYFSKI